MKKCATLMLKFARIPFCWHSRSKSYCFFFAVAHTHIYNYLFPAGWAETSDRHTFLSWHTSPSSSTFMALAIRVVTKPVKCLIIVSPLPLESNPKGQGTDFVTVQKSPLLYYVGPDIMLWKGL